MNSVSVAVPVPLRVDLDYALGELDPSCVQPGVRVRVPLGRRIAVGVVTAPPCQAPGEFDYKPISKVLDEQPLLSPELMRLCAWCRDYYHHPLGLVFSTTLPGLLRSGHPPPVAEVIWKLSDEGQAALRDLPKRSAVLRALLMRLSDNPLPRAALPRNESAALPRARKHGWIEEARDNRGFALSAVVERPELFPEQAAAWEVLKGLPGEFSATLLDGVTGSGKTELYLRLAEAVASAGGQVLILAPEIGLTPQLVERFESRFGGGVAAYHSGMGDVERARAWMAAQRGDAPFVIGTRSAVFVPMARPSLIIVDEEHDTSYKQQDGLRYSARDVAVMRARLAGIPVILGSATPSYESLRNAMTGRYRHVRLQRRIHEDAPKPTVRIIDMRRQALENGLSEPMLEAVGRHLHAEGQVLLFLNRRGFAPALLCHDCAWVAPCPRCDARLTLHRGGRRLICHHCGYTQSPPMQCPSCKGVGLIPVGQGTERVEEALALRFPRFRLERIDSDRTRSARSMSAVFEAVERGEVRILVGTQMLAKGHDFAGLTLAGLVDVDQALYGTDFRALERLAQTMTQVIGRVGRRGQHGEVLLQTHEGEHPQLRTLITQGYHAFAADQLKERQQHGLPPYSCLALLRAESPREDKALAFLRQVRPLLAERVEVMGPVPAPMVRRAGMQRAQLLLRAAKRGPLQAALNAALPEIDALPRSGLRWSLDVDPYDLF